MVFICWPRVTLFYVTAGVIICFNREVGYLLPYVQLKFSERSELSLAWIWGCTARGRKPVFDTLCPGGLNAVLPSWVEQNRQSPRARCPRASAQARRPSQGIWLTKSKVPKKHGGNAEVQLDVLRCDSGLQEPGRSHQYGCRFPARRMLNEHSSRAGAWKAIPVVAHRLGHWVTVICCDQNGFLYKDDYENAWVFVYPVAGGCN